MGRTSPETNARRGSAAAFGRLTRRAQFQRVSKGRRKTTTAFVLQSASREDAATSEPKPRVGFTVTRKIGGAVVRNRIRRRLREALKAALPLEAESDCDYVLMARREALSRDFAELVDDMRNAFRAAARDRQGSRRGPDRAAAKDKT